MKITITRKVGFLLLLPFLGAAVAAVTFCWFLNVTAGDGHFIHLAGTQRTLVEQLSREVHLAQMGRDESREFLREALADFEQSLVILEQGGRFEDCELPPLPPELWPQLEALKQLWGELRGPLILIATHPHHDSQVRVAQEYVQDNLGQLQEASARMITAYEARSRVLRVRMMYFLVALAVINGALFLLGLWLSKRYIARPVLLIEEAARHIQKGDFTRRVPVVTRDELATLARTFNEMSTEVARLLALVDQMRRYNESIVVSVPSGLVTLSADLRVLSANQVFLELFNLPQADLYGGPLEEILPVTGLREEAAAVLSGAATKRSLFHELAYSGVDDERFLRLTIVAVQRVEDEGVTEGRSDARLLLVVEDHTEMETLRAEALQAMQRFQDLAESAAEGIVLTDVQGKVVFLNRAAEEIFDYRYQEIVDQPFGLLLPSISGHQGRWEAEGRRRGGESFPIEGSTSSFQDAQELLYTHVFRDLTERKLWEARLCYLAEHDPLTGLFNRRRFQDELDESLRQARRYHTGGALLYLDLDHFKDVNDRFGHQAGDMLLTSLAGVLRDGLRESDILARLGGDEFAVLLPNMAASEAQAVAAKILEMVRQHAIHIAGHDIGVTGSIGIVLFPGQAATAEEVLACADRALYRAKGEGRNLIVLYQPDSDWDRLVEFRFSWEQRIREALQSDLFQLYCQPILDLRRDRVDRWEILLRLRGDDGEIIPPGAFLSVAEQFGLIHDIDRWVLLRAIRLLSEHQRAGREIELEVNLSGKAFKDRELLPLIQQELAATGVAPSRLVLEITETAAIANISEARDLVTALKDLGCRFALDDFGVGFSSFYYLKHLPVDYLKIDGGFVRDLPRDPVDQHLVRAIVEVARGLGKQTIAEFVEDEETLTLLRKYGVDHAQGYHIGRPRPVSEVWGTGSAGGFYAR